MSPFLTVKELAARWHSSPGSVLNMRCRGEAPVATKVGRKVLFRLADVEAWEAERREPVGGRVR